MRSEVLLCAATASMRHLRREREGLGFRVEGFRV